MTVFRGPLSNPKFKGRFSGHETFPLRHGWLKKLFNALNDFGKPTNAEVFSPDFGMAHFGVGKNMLGAMKHWALAVGLIETKPNGAFQITDFGKILFSDDGIDPFLEDKGTLWLIHWRIASNSHFATTWFWAFNHYVHDFLDRETLRREIGLYADQSKNTRSTNNTIKKDVDCFFRTYVSGSEIKKFVIEDTLECPLTELELIIPSINKGQYEFQRGLQDSLPDWVLLFALLEFWDTHSKAQTMNLETLTFEPGTPGLVFKFDERPLAERLSKIETISDGALRWSDSAGLAQILRVNQTFSPLDVLKNKRHAMTKKLVA